MLTRLHLTLILSAILALAIFSPAGSEPLQPVTAPDRKPMTDLCGDPLPTGAIARMGTVRFRHDGPVSSVAFSPDGKVIASGSDDMTIRLWDASSGKELLRIEEEDPIRSVAFSPDGTMLASGCGNTIRLRDVITGRELRKCIGHDMEIRSVAISPDGKVIITGSEDGTIRFWEVATAAEIHAIKSRAGDIGSLAFSPDGRHLASGHSNTTVMIWDVEALFTADYGKADSLDALWTGLATDTVPKAFAAILALQHGDREAVACLRSKLKPPSLSGDQIQRIQRMLDDLNHEDFVSRDRAEQELLATGDVAVPIVKEAVEKTGSAELKLRANRILEVLQRPLPIPPGEPLRRWRAIQVLERIGSKEAHDVLEMLEKESPSLRERRETKAALERLDRLNRK